MKKENRKKILFLDVDGTLVHAARDEYIPESAIQAIRTARRMGHLVFLCTGRSKAEIYPKIYEIGIDGVIGAAGGFIEVIDRVSGEEKEIFHRTIAAESAAEIAAYLDEHGIDYYMECNEGLYASRNPIPHIRQVLGGNGHFINSLKTGGVPAELDINKISFLETNGSRYQDVYDRFHEDFYMVRCTVPDFGEESGEISVKGINKSTAIHTLLDYLEQEEPVYTERMFHTLAIGDGMNDVEMFQAVDVAIAMGNAKEGLKELADYVTTDILEDGIYNAFRHFGLLEEEDLPERNSGMLAERKGI